MKKIYTILLAFAICLIVGGCLDDKSNTDLTIINIIDCNKTGAGEKLSVFQHDTLEINPLVYKKGFNDKDFSYRWTISDERGEIELGNNLCLKAALHQVPRSFEYKVTLEVTDNISTLKEYIEWDVMVRSPFGEGLIVADTKDGITTDLSLIMAMNFTGMYWKDDSKDTTRIHLYSKCNNCNIDGLVHHLWHRTYGSNRTLECLTKNHILQLEPLSYENLASDSQLFFTPIDKFKPQAIQEISGDFFLINNGKMYHKTMQHNNKSYSYNTPCDSEYRLSENFCVKQYQYDPGPGIVYDELQHRFLWIPSTWVGGPFILMKNKEDYIFNPSNIGNKTCLCMGIGKDNNISSVMKDNDDGSMSVYCIYANYCASPSGDANGTPSHLYDINNCVGIKEAKFFSFTEKEDVLYYANSHQIYAAPLNTGTIGSFVRYEAASGEEITSMIIHRNSGMVKIPNTSEEGDPFINVSAKNRMIIITTYNESTKEGKVITLPVETLGQGILNKDCGKEYKGFDRITCIGVQQK